MLRESRRPRETPCMSDAGGRREAPFRVSRSRKSRWGMLPTLSPCLFALFSPLFLASSLRFFLFCTALFLGHVKFRRFSFSPRGSYFRPFAFFVSFSSRRFSTIVALFYRKIYWKIVCFPFALGRFTDRATVG